MYLRKSPSRHQSHNTLTLLGRIFQLSYAVNNLWPLLCIVESDDAPTAYEPIALTEVQDDGHGKERSSLEAGHEADDLGGNSHNQALVTYSIRALNKKLYSIAGWPSLLRGLRPHMFLNFACLTLSTMLSCIPMMPNFLAVALAPLFTVQLYTAWVHIAMSAPRPESLYCRLPRFKTCFQTTALPTLVLWLAVAFSQLAPMLVFSALHMQTEDPTGLDLIQIPVWSGSFQEILMLASVALAYFLPTILLVIPAHMVLTRVQASMLPPDDEPIVLLDNQVYRRNDDKQEERHRALRGMPMAEAWRSFSAPSWRRLIIMYVKMFLVTLAAEIFMAAALIVQIMLLLASSGFSQNSSPSMVVRPGG